MLGKTTTRPRRSGLGTSGCLTCRIRKVKCDEAKPACHKCRSTGRKCDGYSVLPFSRAELLEGSKRLGGGSRLVPGGNSLACLMLTDVTFQNKVEQRYFQFFRCCTVSCTNLTASLSLTVLQPVALLTCMAGRLPFLGSHHPTGIPRGACCKTCYPGAGRHA